MNDSHITHAAKSIYTENEKSEEQKFRQNLLQVLVQIANNLQSIQQAILARPRS